jgi:hypothetical protein
LNGLVFQRHAGQPSTEGIRKSGTGAAANISELACAGVAAEHVDHRLEEEVVHCSQGRHRIGGNVPLRLVVSKEVGEQERVQVTTDDAIRVEPDHWRHDAVAEGSQRISKRGLIEGAGSRVGEHQRGALRAPPRPARTLEVVGRSGWDVGQDGRAETSDVDTELHGCGGGEDVDLPSLEVLLALLEPVDTDLSRVFLGPQPKNRPARARQSDKALAFVKCAPGKALQRAVASGRRAYARDLASPHSPAGAAAPLVA